MKSINISTLNALKANSEKFAVLTAYDSTFAMLAEMAGIEVLLVGDSLGNVCLGYKSTVPVTMADMLHHTRAVSRGNAKSMIIADMPYMSYATAAQAFANAASLMQAGAQMVKLEGGAWIAPTITGLAERGIPVCGHLGLTPQSVDKLGGYKVQGKDALAASQIISDAEMLEKAGADLLVLECVPSSLGTTITQRLSIPVIGIGAGAETDAQVLVIYDMLGISPKIPRFSHNFLADTGDILKAMESYSTAVKLGSFPGPEHGFS